jgi:hypothetical protein
MLIIVHRGSCFMDKLSWVRQQLDTDTAFLGSLLEGRCRVLKVFLDSHGDRAASIVTHNVIMYTWFKLQPFLLKDEQTYSKSTRKIPWLHKKDIKRQQIIENMLENFGWSPTGELSCLAALCDAGRAPEDSEGQAAPPYEP